MPVISCPVGYIYKHYKIEKYRQSKKNVVHCTMITKVLHSVEEI